MATLCRLEIGDTAGWKPALPPTGRALLVALLVTVGFMLLSLQDRSHFVGMSRLIEPSEREVRMRLGAPASLPAWTRGQLAGKDAGAPRAERLRPQIASPVPRAPTHKNKNQISR